MRLEIDTWTLIEYSALSSDHRTFSVKFSKNPLMKGLKGGINIIMNNWGSKLLLKFEGKEVWWCLVNAQLSQWKLETWTLENKDRNNLCK